MYNSPIEIIYSDIQNFFEEGIFKAIQDVGINVDKDELIKALAYDRSQYEKGYADALAERQQKGMQMNTLIVSVYDDGYYWEVALMKEDGTVVKFQEDDEILEDIITSLGDYPYLRLLSYFSDYKIDKVIWCENGHIDFYNNRMEQ